MDFREFFILLKYILVTRWPFDDSGKAAILNDGCIEKKQDINSLEQSLDQELIRLLQLRSVDREAANSPQTIVCPDGGEHCPSPCLIEPMNSVSRPEWLRKHDFEAASRILRSFLKHPSVKTLGLVPDRMVECLARI